MSSFETRDEHSRAELRPLRVAVRREDVYAEARTMVADLALWKLVRADDERLELLCERAAGFLGRPARVTIRIEGPDGIPTASVHVRSQTDGGWLARDKANVREFLEPFSRRVG